MAYRVSWSPTAQLDLKDLSAYIAKDKPVAARKFVRGVLRTVLGLSDFPEMGRPVPEFKDPSIREIVRRPCRIVYRIKKKEELVEIVRVWHAARGIPEV